MLPFFGDSIIHILYTGVLQFKIKFRRLKVNTPGQPLLNWMTPYSRLWRNCVYCGNAYVAMGPGFLSRQGYKILEECDGSNGFIWRTVPKFRWGMRKGAKTSGWWNFVLSEIRAGTVWNAAVLIVSCRWNGIVCRPAEKSSKPWTQHQ
jgi:hypothetical protein